MGPSQTRDIPFSADFGILPQKKSEVHLIFYPAAQDLFLSNKLAYRISGPWTMAASSYTNYGGRLKGLLFPVMDMMGRAFGTLKFGQASAYGFVLTVMIVAVTAILFYIQRKVDED